MVAGGSTRLPIATRMGNASSICVGKKMEQMMYSPMYPPPGTPLMPTDDSTATSTTGTRLPQLIS